MTDKKQEDKPIYPSMITFLQENIDWRTKDRDRAKVYYDKEQSKLDYAILRKEHYEKTGVLLPQEQEL